MLLPKLNGVVSEFDCIETDEVVRWLTVRTEVWVFVTGLLIDSEGKRDTAAIVDPA